MRLKKMKLCWLKMRNNKLIPSILLKLNLKLKIKLWKRAKSKTELNSMLRLPLKEAEKISRDIWKKRLTSWLLFVRSSAKLLLNQPPKLMLPKRKKKKISKTSMMFQQSKYKQDPLINLDLKMKKNQRNQIETTIMNHPFHNLGK